MSVLFLPLRLIPQSVQCVIISTVLNLVLLRDDKLRALAYDLENRVFRVHVRDQGFLFYLLFHDGQVQTHPSHDGDADVRITAETAAFARMIFDHEDPDDLVFRQLLRISGDSESMLRFKKIMQAADVNWETELQSAFGHFFGRRIAQAAKKLMDTEEKLRQNIHHSLQQQLSDINIPDQQRLQQWQAGVEHLQHRQQRLEQRIRRLEQRWQGTTDK